VNTRDVVVKAIDKCMLKAADLGDDPGFMALRALLAGTWKAFKAIIAEQIPAVQLQDPRRSDTRPGLVLPALQGHRARERCA
jgi:hypothetical protein